MPDDDPGFDDELQERIREDAEALGISEVDAAFMLAQLLGEVDSDEVLVDEDGREIKRPDPNVGSA